MTGCLDTMDIPVDESVDFVERHTEPVSTAIGDWPDVFVEVFSRNRDNAIKEFKLLSAKVDAKKRPKGMGILPGFYTYLPTDGDHPKQRIEMWCTYATPLERAQGVYRYSFGVTCVECGFMFRRNMPLSFAALPLYCHEHDTRQPGIGDTPVAKRSGRPSPVLDIVESAVAELRGAKCEMQVDDFVTPLIPQLPAPEGGKRDQRKRDIVRALGKLPNVVVQEGLVTFSG